MLDFDIFLVDKPIYNSMGKADKGLIEHYCERWSWNQLLSLGLTLFEIIHDVCLCCLAFKKEVNQQLNRTIISISSFN